MAHTCTYNVQLPFHIISMFIQHGGSNNIVSLEFNKHCFILVIYYCQIGCIEAELKLWHIKSGQYTVAFPKLYWMGLLQVHQRSSIENRRRFFIFFHWIITPEPRWELANIKLTLFSVISHLHAPTWHTSLTSFQTFYTGMISSGLFRISVIIAAPGRKKQKARNSKTWSMS